tara:strand:- start:6506 stop:7648 length:1143 start_codon:yes stop_codon:yes gene_type:complete
MNKTNLLFLGTTNYGFNLTKSDQNKFKELDTKFNVYVFTLGPYENLIDFEFVKIKYLKKPQFLFMKYLRFYFFSILKLNKFINENKITIVSAKDPISALNPIILKILFRKQIKVIIENHGNFKKQLLEQRDSFFISKFIFLTEFIVKFVFKHVDLLRGVNEQNSNYFKKYNSNLKIYNFPAWIDSSIFSIENEEPRKDLLFVGNIIKRKGVYFLIHALSTYLSENQHVQLKIIGKKEDQLYYEKIVDFINKNNLQESIVFLDEITHIEIAKYMNSSKILLMASTSEGLPRVLIEAGFCGLPSIASNIDGIQDPFFLKGGTLIYELNSQKELVKNVESLYNNKDLWKKLSQQSQKLSDSIAGKGSFVKNWENLINLIEVDE